MQKVRIAQVGGFASTNIGNDFFTRSIQHVLSLIATDGKNIITQNLPGYYWKENKTNPRNSLNYLKLIEPDFLVLTGPLFDANFPLIWKDTISHLKSKGTRFLFFSAGSQKYSEAERKTVREFLEFVEPYAIISRDEPTFEAYKDLAEHSYNGVDFAFFVDEIFVPYKLYGNAYVIINFDTGPEPMFGRESDFNNKISFLGQNWSYQRKSVNKYVKFIKNNLGLGNKFHNKYFGEYEIIRPRNYLNPGHKKLLFSVPNSFVSELAEDYLNLFANAEGVLSSRVHSCLASLVFGKEAMLFSNTARGQLFDRVGLHNIREQPVKLDQVYIKEEKKKMIDFLKKII